VRREVDLEGEGAEPLALERNLALMAGAGAGKTYSLMTICLHLLGGARRDGRALRPAALFLLTFTEKAAGEMRTRLRDRVGRLARGTPGPTEELELQASFARHGRPFPPPDFWRRVRDDLGAATIGTFHSLCVQLLRRAPAGFGVDPAFELLEEGEASALLSDCAERVILEALQRGEPGVEELCRDMDFRGDGQFRVGLVDFMCRVFTRIREEGQSPANIGIGDEERARAEFDRAVHAFAGEVATATQEDLGRARRFLGVLQRCARAVAGMTAENFLELGRWPEIREALDSEENLARNPHMQPVDRGAHGYRGKGGAGQIGLVELYAAIVACRQEQTFRRLLVALQSRHREELDKRAVLDFTDLLIRTRNLLRDEPSVRMEVQGRVHALLVDEFQDTNRLQLELVTLLAEKRDGAPRLVRDGDEEKGSGEHGQLGLPLDARRGRPIGVEEIPLQPAMLAAVGDRKQSIYEFRGADVSVFERLAQQIERNGGTRHFLQHNRRSSPELLGFFNALFARVMVGNGEERDYEVAYVPEEDDLRPVRPQQVEPPVVERLVYELKEKTIAADCRRIDAEVVARRVKALLAPNGPHVVVGKDGVPRRARGGDIALLFRAFTSLETYRQALIRHGVPHRVVRGRGFYGAQEVLDLASLLALVANPQDRISLAAVLRSPLVALSDASLFQLAWGEGPGPRLDLLPMVRDGAALPPLPPKERARLERFLSLYPRLRRERDRLGLRTLLQVVLEETGFRVALAGTAYAEQALANVEKLLELAGRWDARGLGDAATFSHELVRLAEEEPREAQADVIDAGDPRAVNLMTVHRAKGLEWPVVVVPDLAALKPVPGDRVAFDRRLGLALKPLLPGEIATTETPTHLRVVDELRRRDKAESLRTLYVALTRARDLLVLSGKMASTRNGSWRQILDEALDSSTSVRAAVKDVDVEQLPPAGPPPVAAPERAERSNQRVQRALDRARSPVLPAGNELVLPVTQLQDFFLCPRRYHYAHEIGLSEHPVVLELPEEAEAREEGGPAADAGDPRRRGTLAHALLEKVDLSVLRRGGPALRHHLERLLWSVGERAEDAGNQEIVADVEAFLRTRFAARLAAAGEARVHRELPFLLRVGAQGAVPSLFVKGKIDLLLEDGEGGALVLDYKYSRLHPEGLQPYSFQLDCYALAARQYLREGVPIRTGIAFLKENGREPDLCAEGSFAPAPLEARLLEGARQLLQHSRTPEWPGQPRAECERIRCGYRYRCHPEKPEGAVLRVGAPRSRPT
jgi:ATP-dependent helicase/nuclease subunit A